MRTADTAAKMTNWPEEGITILMKRTAVYRADTAVLGLRIKNAEKTFYIIEGEKTQFDRAFETVMRPSVERMLPNLGGTDNA